MGQGGTHRQAVDLDCAGQCRHRVERRTNAARPPEGLRQRARAALASTDGLQRDYEQSSACEWVGRVGSLVKLAGSLAFRLTARVRTMSVVRGIRRRALRRPTPEVPRRLGGVLAGGDT